MHGAYDSITQCCCFGRLVGYSQQTIRQRVGRDLTPEMIPSFGVSISKMRIICPSVVDPNQPNKSTAIMPMPMPRPIIDKNHLEPASRDFLPLVMQGRRTLEARSIWNTFTYAPARGAARSPGTPRTVADRTPRCASTPMVTERPKQGTTCRCSPQTTSTIRLCCRHPACTLMAERQV